MTLARYQGQPAAFIGARRYWLTPQLAKLPAGHPDRSRVEAVCEIALEVRRLTGYDATRWPPPDPGRTA